jgi:esterase/lipase superfamily enzyme
MRRFPLTLAAVAMLSWAGGADLAAQSRTAERIDKVANHRLIGSAYASLRGLSYEQCERRCLADHACRALEHIRGGTGGANTSQCRLFRAFGSAHAAANSDVGYKRPTLAKDIAPPVGPAPTARPSAPSPKAAPTARPIAPSPKAVSAPPPAPTGAEPRRKTFAMKRSVAPAEPAVGSPGPSPVPSPSPPPASSAPPPAPSASSPPPPPVGSPAPPPMPPSVGASKEEITRDPESEGAERRTTRSVAPAPTPPAGSSAAPASDWAVVPVFFGTDRSRLDREKRIGYGPTRGHRLEVGRALVTVPKAHQVPNVERPWTIRIPYTSVVLYQQEEDPRKHFTVQELKALSKDDLLALIRDRLSVSKNFENQALVFVHGYNNAFDDALFRTAQIAYDLNYDGASFLYSWPSGAGISGYPYDRESAQQAEPYLKQFLEMVLNETGAKSVSIIAHSMGNQLLLQVLRSLDRSNPQVARINQIILAAPDVDRDSFEFLATQIRGVGHGITMYASSNDLALGISRRFAGGVPRAGDVPAGLGPIVVGGVDTIDVSALSTEYLSLNHSSYAEKTGLLKDIELILRTGTRPPEIRLPLLERIAGGQGIYWRYPK